MSPGVVFQLLLNARFRVGTWLVREVTIVVSCREPGLGFPVAFARLRSNRRRFMVTGPEVPTRGGSNA